MTNVESGRAAGEARTQMKAEPAAKAVHGDPLARYLGAMEYEETKDKDKDQHGEDDKR